MKKKFLIVALSVALVVYPSAGTALAEEMTSNAEIRSVEMETTDVSASDINTTEEGSGAVDTEKSNVTENNESKEGSAITSGECGENLTWVLNGEGTLTVSGEGEMNTGGVAPWKDYADEIINVVIENGVTSIGEKAFDRLNNLEKVDIPKSVTKIGNQAFAYSSNLTDAVIPDSVIEIGDTAFGGCVGLRDIIIPDSVIKIGRFAFQSCSGAMNLKISENVKVIEEYTFAYCSNLKEIVIPKGVTSIGTFSFSSCDNLTDVIIPDTVQKISGYAFAYCESLLGIEIPEGVVELGDMAFFQCTKLNDISIPDSVKKIGTGVFEETPWISKNTDENGFLIVNGILLEYSNVSENPLIPSGVTSIGAYVFWGNDSLKNIVLPDTVTDIQYGAFSACSSLSQVEIPDSVVTIDARAFLDTALTSVTIPESVVEIGEYAIGYETKPEAAPWEAKIPVENFTIYGYEGSAAETYAADNNLSFSVIETPTEEIPDLEILPERTDETYIKGSGTGAVIYCTGEFADFVSVAMDGKLVDEANYTVEEGSTVLTFLSSYLDTLSAGRHEVTLNYVNGSVTTWLTIMNDESDAGTNAGNGNSTDQNVTDSGSGSTNSSSNANASNTVKTGDHANYMLWFALLVGSGCICTAAFKMRKREA